MSKTKKKGIRSLAILLALILTLGFSPVTNAEAKSVPRLNYKKVTLVQGKKKKLKVRNLRRRRKVKWYSTKKSVATVNRKGVVKAKKKGKATIVAKVGKKKYRCKIIVKKKTSKKKTTGKKVKLNKKKEQLLNRHDAFTLYSFSATVDNEVSILKHIGVANAEVIEKTPKAHRSKYYKWYSSDNSILSIDVRNFTAIGKKVGTVKVYCKYLGSNGNWRKSQTVTVKVFSADELKLTYSVSLDTEKAKGAKYHIWNTEKKNLFNTINVNVTNTSDKSIKLSSIVEFRIGSNSFIFSSNGNTELLAGESKTIIYQSSYYYDAVYAKCFENYILDYEDVGSVWFTYYSNNKKVYYTYHREKYIHSPRENYWEYR